MELFKRFLMEQDIPRRIRVCYQCGVCAGGCPVGEWQWDFNPRRFIEMILRDEIDFILKDNKIWLCAYCLTCIERCPQKIEVSEIMVQLKNAASRMDNIPENEIKKSREVMKTGWVQNPGKRILRIRQELGLPEIPQGIESSMLQNMDSHLGWKEKMESIRKIKAQTSDGSENRPLSVEKGKAGG